MKALVCAAALAAGLASSMAQTNVYSLNVVGYYNVTVPQGGLTLIANQLNTTNNQIQYLIPSPPDYSQIFVYNGGYAVNQYVGPDNFGSGWSTPTFSLDPGVAVLYQDPGTPGGQTLTFVGEVLQGVLTKSLTLNGLSFVADKVPVATTLAGMALPAEDYDNVFIYSGGWAAYQYVGPDNFGNGWSGGLGDGNGPTVPVGAGFAYQKASGNTLSSWVQNFTVQ
jgi:hypothetical protein